MSRFGTVTLQVVALLVVAGAEIAEGQETTPAMVAAAAKEGKVSWYTSVDVKVAEAVAKAFRAEYPNIEIDVERSGARLPAHQPGIPVGDPQRRCRQLLGRIALHFLEAAEVA